MKGGWRIVKPEGHYSISISAKRTCKCGLLLIFGSYGDLVVTGVAIKETIMAMSRKAFQHLVDKKERKVVFSSACVQLPIVDTYPPSCL